MKALHWLAAAPLILGSATSMALDHIVLAAEDDWYPFSGIHKGRHAGFSPELIRAAFATQGVDVSFRVMPLTRCLALARTSHVLDCVESIRGQDIENLYVWHQVPMFKSRLHLYARKNSNFVYRSIQDLQNGPRVGVTVGYEYGNEFDRSRSIRRDIANTDLQGLNKLLLGRVDLMPVYDKVYASLASSNPDIRNGLKAVGTLMETDLYIAFSRQHPDAHKYADLLDKGLQQLQASGEYQKIENRWK